MKQLARIDTLRQKTAAGEEPAIPQEEYQQFLKKNGTVAKAYVEFFDSFPMPSAEQVRFSTLKQAKDFYEKIMRKPGFWEEQRRIKPKSFRRPGFVALDFLINLWGFRREDASAMLELKPGSLYKPSPIYKGYAVFKILEIRKADEKKFEERQQYYFDRVKSIKQYEGFKAWLEQLKRDADIKKLITP